MGFLKRKRTKAAPPPKDDTKHDLAPREKDFRLENDPIPKNFLRAMAKAEIKGKKRGPPTTQKGAKEGTDNQPPEKKQKTGGKATGLDALVRRDGETFKEFSKRIEDETRNKINTSVKQQTKTAQKRKEKLKQRKQQREQKRRKGKTKEDMEGRLTDGHATVPFGVQADAPPSLSVKPRKIGGKNKLAMMSAAAQERENEEDDTGGDDPTAGPPGKSESDGDEVKVGRKIKLKDLPLSQQKAILTERANAIETYRQAKARRIAMASSQQ
ncbi:hypothetical protein HDU96_008374 [Phlyctochytrium bullatum]|nr:hypothetical protein HDU96_008374 [Phlyctochytrium bullatum]